MEAKLNLTNLDILNPDLEISQSVLNQLEQEVYEDLVLQLPELKEVPISEVYTTHINENIAINYVENLGMTIPTEFKNSLFTIQLIANFIRYSEQQRILMDLLKKYLANHIPELDLNDPCKILMQTNFSNSFIVFKKRLDSSIQLDSLTIKYNYDYDTEDFSFKIISANSQGFTITLKQLRMLLDLDVIENESYISTTKSSDNNKIKIIMPDGKQIII